MRLIEIIYEDVDPTFPSLDAICVWGEKLGVTLDASEYALKPGSRYAGHISVTWIQRKRGKPGTGARVMSALCRYADATHSTIDLQADDEIVLPEYYAGFGFKIIKTDNGDDVEPTGPDMQRRPKTRKATQPLGSTAPAPTTSTPIGVATLWTHETNTSPCYFTVFDPTKVNAAKKLAFNSINDADDTWVGYVVDSLAWTALASKIGVKTPMSLPRALWDDLHANGKVVFRLNLDGPIKP